MRVETSPFHQLQLHKISFMFKSLKHKHVLVTGAGGFIGSHLVEQLIPLCGKVTALLHYDSRPDWGNLEHTPKDLIDSVEVLQGDVTDAGFVYRLIKEKDVVFHLAALIAIPYSYHAPQSYFQTNILGTVNILEACREHGVSRLVTVSTSECYGTALYTPMNENHPLQAQSPYSASKIGADKAVESFCRTFDLPAVIIRPFNTYGPRQSARAVIPTIISQALSPQPEMKLGSVTPVRDFTYIKDTALGMIAGACADGVNGETINLGTGEGITIGKLADKIQAIIGTNKPVVTEDDRIRPSASEVMELKSNNQKAKQMLDWQPQFSLDDGLKETIEFYKTSSANFKSGRYTI